MNIYKLSLTLLIPVLLFVCCNSKKTEGDSDPRNQTGVNIDNGDVNLLELDFKNNPLATDTPYVASQFSQLTASLIDAPEEIKTEVINTLLENASDNKQALDLLISIARLYLYDSNSPLRSDELFIPFLRYIIRSPLFDETEKERAETQLSEALLNRQGTKAADFSMIMREGNSVSMFSLLTMQENVLLFYDSDCIHCKEIMSNLAINHHSPDETIIAVDVSGNKELWDTTNSTLPASWKVGYDSTGLEEGNLYSFRALPTFYILSQDGTVLLKDPSPSLLIK